MSKIRRHSHVHGQPCRPVLLTIEPLEERRAPAAFVVTTNLDGNVPNQTTLRQAITMSNATTGPNSITFAIGSGGVQTISLTSPLPALTQPVIILGGSQTGTTYMSPGIILNGSGAGAGDAFDVAGGNSTIEGFIIQNFNGNGIVLKTKGSDEVINDAIGTNANLNGAGANTMDGVLINNVANNAIQNCVISGNDFNGIEITGSAAAHNLIGTGNTANVNVGTPTGGPNFVGVDISGTIAVPNLLDGILIHNSANNTAVTGNVISANGANGVHITGVGASAPGGGTTGNVLLANYIGTDISGTLALGNKADGILLDGGATSNQIGDGTTANANVISANGGNGIHLTGIGTGSTGRGTTANTVLGDFIGTDISGTLPLGNTGSGILIDNGANTNTIGAVGSVNVISDNLYGVHITGSGSTENVFLGNYIGTDVSGSVALGNTGDGILIDNGASVNKIGSDAAGSANIISANGGSGIHISGTGGGSAGSGTTGNIVLGNYIGTDVTGSAALGNTHDGILIDNGANANKIGDGSTGGINVISANDAAGIELNGGNLVIPSGQVGTANNTILGNYIGVDITGSVAVGNLGPGILIDAGASNNSIGAAGSVNVISGNLIGIHIAGTGAGAAGSGTTGNVIIGNYVGTDVTGGNALGNTGDGILIDNGANATKIGNGTAAGINVISANGGAGIEINGGNLTPSSGQVGTSNNTVLENYIGTDVTGSNTLGNTGDGVLIDNGASGNTIGSGTSHNVISANENGVRIIGNEAVAAGSGTTGNILLGNYIGTDVTGTQELGNINDGILIGNGANANKIGNGTAAGANVISGNGANGIELDGGNLTPSSGQVGTSNNTVIENFIGTDLTGTQFLGNTGDGVLIDNGASGNTIGAATSHNVISANYNGIHITGTGAGAAGSGTTGNVIIGNYVGTDITGTMPVGNTNDGILIDNGANGNAVGNGTAGGLNVISANGANGIEIDGGNLTPANGQVGTANNTILENYLGTDATGKVALGNTNDGVLIDNGASGNTIGANASHNVISGNGNNGLEISGAGTSANIVLGNYIGPDKTGVNPLPNGADGVLVGAGASGNTIGGVAAGARNVISGNNGNGVQLDGAGTTGNNVTGNYIGTDSTGAVIMANGVDGVLISDGASANHIGNGTAAGVNVISGNSNNGVEINSANGNFITGNLIGPGVTGNALGNLSSGVSVENSNNNVIGGETAGAGNTIELSGGNGVTIASGTGNAIQQNSIYSSGQLGIDLDNDGVTPNTPGGANSGANNDENYPVITSAVYAGGTQGTNVYFTFNSTPNSTFDIELFASPAANASGYGEGKTPLTPIPIVVTTDANGDAINPATNTTLFSVDGLQGVLPGSVITATATDAGMDTSEFSQAVPVVPIAPNVDNVTYVVGAHNRLTGLQFSFSEALAPASVNSGDFEIFTAGAHDAYTTPVKLARVAPVTYDPATDTVTISTLTPLVASRIYKVFINGTNDPVTNGSGVALDGEFTSVLPSGDGIPGGNFEAFVSYGTHFSYKDSHSNSVSLSLTRGGAMEFIQPVDGADAYLELAKVVSGKTTLSGKVRAGKTGTGVTTIEALIGLDGAIDKLPSAQFDVVNYSGSLEGLSELSPVDAALTVLQPDPLDLVTPSGVDPEY